jgi:uncharacterized protein
MRTMQSYGEKWDELLNLKDSLFVFDVKDKNYLFDKYGCNFSEIDAGVKHIVSCLLHGMSFNAMKEDYTRLFSNDNLDEILNELSMLYSNGFLTAEDKLSKIKGNGGGFVSALCLIMATDCNLRCKYCFAGDGNYNHIRKKMSIDVAEKSIDFLVRNAGRRKDLALSFFGGEPLLNFKGIKEIVMYAEKTGLKHGKKFSFSVTTNGTLLNPEMMDFFVEHDFSYIISLDGPKEVNDRFRVFPNGSGTYDIVRAKQKAFVKRYPQVQEKITLRGTFTAQTSDISKSLYHLKQLGFNNISLEPCASKDKDFQINGHNLRRILEEYDKVAKLYLESIKSGDEFSFFHLHQLFFQVAEGAQRTAQCGAGFGYLTVDPDGTIYPCHRLVGDSRYIMGNIRENVFQNTLDHKICEIFKRASVNHKPACKKCWAKYICGGGCHATAIQFNDDILQPYTIECELMKQRIKLGVWVYSQLEG